MLECVVNVSEGRRREVVAAVAAACGSALIDVHTDPDHNRSVLTLAGRADEVAEAAMALARTAVERIDLSGHSGAHPRLGVVDVVPFVPLDLGEDAGRRAARRGLDEGPPGLGEAGEPGPPGLGEAGEPGPPGLDEVGESWRVGLEDGGPAGLEEAAEVARAWGERAATELGVPVFFYGAADPAGRALPDLRRAAFRERAPDFGPDQPHPTAGAMAVGARPVLVAINCELAAGGGGLGADLVVARAVARAIRERDGGRPGVRALGFALESKGRAQVSMNLTDLASTGVEAACEAVRRAATERGSDVTAVELVGLLPAAELERCSEAFLAWSGLTADQTIETRFAARPAGPPPKPERSEE